MKKIGYGVVGLGMGMTHLDLAAANPNVGYVAYCDINEERMARAAANHPDAVPYREFDEMIKDEKIDIISIALPTGMHAEFTIKALEAGKHVLCEKPIDINVERGLAVEEARVRTGKKVGLIFQNRNNAVIREAKKTIEDGKLGKILLGTFAVKWYRNQPYYDAGGWRGTWDMDGGGSLMNQSVHTVDLMQYLMGDVESVQGHYTIANHVIETEDLTTSVIKFKNGALATFVSTTCCNPNRGTYIQVYGADGAIEINGDVLEAWKTVDSTPESDAEMMAKYATGNAALVAADPTLAVGHKSQIDDMIDAVINDRDPQVGPMEAIKAVRIINAVYESSRTGKVIYFD